MDERIEVGYRNIGSALGKDYHHKYLIYTDSQGEQHTISGWTGDPEPGLPYGRIHVEPNLPFDASNPDHPDNPNTTGQRQYRELIATGPDLSQTWQRMVADAQSKDDRYPYDPQLQNSNTLADSVLRSVNLPEPRNDGFFGHWSPASGRTLDPNVQPVVPGLGNSGRTFSAADTPTEARRAEAARQDPLFQQALAGLDRIGPDAGGYQNQEEKERVAVALAVQAKTHTPPLPEIQDVQASQTNGNLFAVWTNPGNDQDVMRPHVDKLAAAQQPLEDNLLRLDTLNRQQAQEQEQVASRNIDEPGRSSLRVS